MEQHKEEQYRKKKGKSESRFSWNHLLAYFVIAFFTLLSITSGAMRLRPELFLQLQLAFQNEKKEITTLLKKMAKWAKPNPPSVSPPNFPSK